MPYLVTLWSTPAVKASLSLAPKHTSITGARCSNWRTSVAEVASPSSTSYR